ncbi:hypothetical protein CMV_028465 [Castanea mollissima]|uniref:Uncharacterized protein n=1 Tax=Castanea mollissima TaxID=60419 RepID=A0A8J4QG61_9ROSI|nr:hypothetical protein CMV_028465 [Castanea mollissima]
MPPGTMVVIFSKIVKFHVEECRETAHHVREKKRKQIVEVSCFGASGVRTRAQESGPRRRTTPNRWPHQNCSYGVSVRPLLLLDGFLEAEVLKSLIPSEVGVLQLK